MGEEKRRQKILALLQETYKGAKTALRYKNTFELLIATMLAAQSTDRQVNVITASLFKKYPDPASFARLTPEELEEDIKGVGLYKSKSRHIIAACRQILEKHHGQVPQTREELEALPGVGRKTANVVLSIGFGQPALAVDTHVFRVANRLKLAEAKDPLETERQLCAWIPRALWSEAHHWLIYHGRQVCKARHPLCHQCVVAEYCASRRAS
ncbi:MAG TPA: endonuclease III [Clostridia bacterium]|nr:endonuclease III [Clostridia bacterium]